MISIVNGIVKKIEYHAEQTYPEECCGILLGEYREGNYVIVDCLAMINSQDENRKRRFFVTPDQYRKAESMANEMHCDLLGFYHSHPDHPAAPSAFDTEHALPWFAYLILAVHQGKARTMTGWILDDNRSQFLEQTMVIEHAPQVHSAHTVNSSVPSE